MTRLCLAVAALALAASKAELPVFLGAAFLAWALPLAAAERAVFCASARTCLARTGRVDAFAAARLGFGDTFAADLPVVRIDHVLPPEGSTVSEVRVIPVVASDHRAVVAEFAVTGTGAPRSPR